MPLSRKDIEASVETLRASLDPNATTLGDIPTFDVDVSHQLFKTLLAPGRAQWGSARNIMVVAGGALGQFPFSILVTEPVKLGPEKGEPFARYRDIPWLARSHATTVVPSVTALIALKENRRQTPGRL